MKRIGLLFLSLLFCFGSIAGTTVIQGSVKDFDGEMLRVATYEDYISYQKNYLGKTEIKDGQFRIEIDLEKTSQVLLLIQDKQSSFFAESGQVYNLFIEYKVESNQDRAFEKYLDLKFSFPQANELNQRIKQFNTAYQEFFSENYKEIVVNEAGKKISNFIKEQEENENYRQPAYLKNYVKYALATLKLANNESKEDLAKEYLIDQEVLIEHKEYMSFFDQFYAKDFEQLLITKKGSDLMKAIMFDRDLNKSLNLIKEFKGFKQAELAELYLMHGLFEVYYKKTVEQKSSLQLLRELGEKASSNELRILANNLHTQLKEGGENAKAPAFSLLDSKGEKVNLTDLSGKAIYLNFWANWSVVSLREMKLMKKLEEEFGDQIHFISINIDEDPSIFKKVKESNSYPWAFLYAGDKYQLRDQYQVKTVPIYFLIDENGKFIKRFAAGPQNIRQELKRLSSVGG